LEDRFLPTLSVPTLVAPSGLIMNTMPALTWDAVTGADFYVVRVQDKTAGNILAAGATHVTGTSFTPPTALHLGDEYQWTVQAETKVSGKSAVSAPFDFTEISPFAGSYSGSFAGTTSGNIAFTVADSGAITVTEPGAGSGSINLAGTAQMKATAAGVSYTFTGTFTVVGGAVSANGSFQSTSKTGGGSGSWSGSATTLVGKPLDTPAATVLSGGSIFSVGSLAEAPNFSWQTVNGADFYAVKVFDKTAHGALVLNSTDISGTSFVSPKLLVLGHSYVWSLEAFDNKGDASPLITNTFAVTSPLSGTYSGTFTGTAHLGGKTHSLSGSVLDGVGISGFTNVEAPGNGNGTGTVDIFGHGVVTTEGPGKVGSVNVGTSTTPSPARLVSPAAQARPAASGPQPSRVEPPPGPGPPPAPASPELLWILPRRPNRPGRASSLSLLGRRSAMPTSTPSASMISRPGTLTWCWRRTSPGPRSRLPRR